MIPALRPIVSRHILARLSTAVTLAALLAWTFPRLPGIAHAADTGTHVGTVSKVTLTRVGTVNLGTLQAATASAGAVKPISPPNIFPEGADDQSAAAHAAAVTPNAPAAGSATVARTANVVKNLLGLTITDSGNSNFPWINEPPDQALCASSVSTVEAVNQAIEVFGPDGSVTKGPIGLWNFFLDQYPGEGESLSDPRCYYDAPTHTWFFLVLGFVEGEGSHIDLAVSSNTDALGSWAVYRIDTTDPTHAGCPCLADQPLLGVDSHGVYLSVNEFSWPNDISGVGQIFNGAQIFAIDKQGLISNEGTPTSLVVPGVTSINAVKYADITNGGAIAGSMEPAMTRGPANAEFFMDSLDPNGTTDNRLAVWAMSNTASLANGGTPTLTGVVITSEKYGQPPNSLEKNAQGESYDLNADDDRMLQVTNYNGVLWGSLNTVIKPAGDTANRVGAAWFAVSPHLSTAATPTITGASILRQGYVGLKGAYLLYPAIAISGTGRPAMVMSESSAVMYPSAVVATGAGFGTLTMVAQGVDPEDGFSCTPTCRWGDYSAATSTPEATPGGSQPYLWLATEYVPSAQFGDTSGDWGTRVIKIVP